MDSGQIRSSDRARPTRSGFTLSSHLLCLAGGSSDGRALRAIVAAGLDPDNLSERGAIDLGKNFDIAPQEARPKRRCDIILVPDFRP